MASPAIELFLRQAGRGVGRINARSSAIQQALQPFAGNVQGYYAPIQAQESALGGALSGSLASQGAAGGGYITSALQGIQAPQQAVDQYGAGMTQQGAAAGQAVGALSSADVARLHAESTAEQIYASALPRLAQLAGDQERRAFMEQAQQNLGDLALQEAQRQHDQAIQERDFQYRARQDALDRARQRRDDRQKMKETAYQHRQDKVAQRRQDRLDKLAAAAAAQQYGLDITKVGLSASSQAETKRHHQQTEAASARTAAETKRHHTAQENKKTGSTDNKLVLSTREDAFKRAREYRNPKSRLADPVPRSAAKARLWAEFGTLLVGHGVPRDQVNAMLERALSAAGY